MVIEASPTRREKVELRLEGTAELLPVGDRWYESEVRYMLVMPERLDEHPASGRANKQVAAASAMIITCSSEISSELVGKRSWVEGMAYSFPVGQERLMEDCVSSMNAAWSAV